MSSSWAQTSCAALSGAVVGGALVAAAFWLELRSSTATKEKRPATRLPDGAVDGPRSSEVPASGAETPGIGLVSESPLWHSGWSKPKVEKAGIAPQVTLMATLPYTVQPHVDESAEMLLTTCNVYFAPSIQEMVHTVLRTREVAGIPGVTFGDIIDIVLNKGASRVYACGGFLRDAFCGQVADDMDFLLRSTGGSLVPFLESVAKGKGWPVYRKSDEKTGQSRWDFIAIGDKDAKMKWSAHPCGSGCEGDFCMNTLLYDIHSGSLIDPTGKGIQDSVNFILRHNRASFKEWVEEDRLPGMKLIRYFNFVSRGYSPANHDFRAQVVAETLKILPTDVGKVTMNVFLKRKLFRGNAESSLQREVQFRQALITEVVKSGQKQRKEAVQWYLTHVACCYGSHLPKFHGLEGDLLKGMKAISTGEGLAWRKPW
eukprot:gb/GFBE01041950.1/.p1 GENE.gb/GFBE01041950.1/~~gb/GFBE01041950.1/.p1  ORF type:complete len:428 (+),score=86.86 gb/GFBE01041950.1/:1-1284(+)